MKTIFSDEWNSIYKWIMKTLSLNKKDDEKAKLILAGMLEKEEELEILYQIINNREVIVIGAGPKIHTEFQLAMQSIEDPVIIAADGATRYLHHQKLQPDIIVTDLDGITLKDIEKTSIETPIIIHAHGDNIKTLKELVPHIKGRKRIIYGTTQLQPSPPIYNFGGFTDGDRSVFTAIFFGAKKIILTGMNYNEKIGIFSKPYYSRDMPITPMKKKKLYIAEQLISWLICDEKEPIEYVDKRKINCIHTRPWENIKEESLHENRD